MIYIHLNWTKIQTNTGAYVVTSNDVIIQVDLIVTTSSDVACKSLEKYFSHDKINFLTH